MQKKKKKSLRFLLPGANTSSSMIWTANTVQTEGNIT